VLFGDVVAMMYEKIKTRRKEGISTKIGGFLGSIARMLDFFADMLQYEIEEREVKQP
jgi:hypothetical protein